MEWTFVFFMTMLCSLIAYKIGTNHTSPESTTLKHLKSMFTEEANRVIEELKAPVYFQNPDLGERLFNKIAELNTDNNREFGNLSQFVYQTHLRVGYILERINEMGIIDPHPHSETTINHEAEIKKLPKGLIKKAYKECQKIISKQRRNSHD